MNYAVIYEKLIERGRTRNLIGYSEQHHIVPKCLGGSNDPNNLVNLTAEEHFVAHQLLVKMYPNPALIFALNMMCVGSSSNIRSNKRYGWIKKRLAEAQRERSLGPKNNSFGTCWATNGIEVKKFKQLSDIPPGWVRGKTLLSVAKQRKIDADKRTNIRIQQNRKLYSEYYEIYKKIGFDQFRIKTGYAYSQANLVKQFARYCPMFIPQMGKNRA